MERFWNTNYYVKDIKNSNVNRKFR